MYYIFHHEREDEDQRERKRKHEEDTASWDRRKANKKEIVASVKKQIAVQDRNVEEALDVASTAKKAANRNAALAMAKLARINLSELTQKLSNAEKELGTVLTKKLKLK